MNTYQVSVTDDQGTVVWSLEVEADSAEEAVNEAADKANFHR
jgi:hypothetical protein